MRKFLLVSISSLLLVLVTYFLPYGTWAEINSLPAHPLIVHGIVVLLPIASVLIIIGIFKKSLLQKVHLFAIFSLSLASVGVLAAKSSGDSLSAAVGLPEFHAEWGNNLVPLAMAFLASFIIYSYFTFHKKVRLVSHSLSLIIVVLAIGNITMTYIVGHSGAESVWKDSYAQAKVPLSSTDKSITKEEVSLHNSYTDCWTIVGNGVYDVTSFVNRHPAGSPAIKEMCGKNASEDYLSEHSGQQEPEMWLEKLKIGKLTN